MVSFSCKNLWSWDTGLFLFSFFYLYLLRTAVWVSYISILQMKKQKLGENKHISEEKQ